MKKLNIYRELLLLGIWLIVLGNIIAVGYGLYLWTGVGFLMALWTAFKVWLLIDGLGGLLILSAIYIA